MFFHRALIGSLERLIAMLKEEIAAKDRLILALQGQMEAQNGLISTQRELLDERLKMITLLKGNTANG